MPRPRHKCQQTEKVLRRLERAGWTIDYPSGHWGRAKCGDGCSISVYGTPPECTTQAKIVERTAKKCLHGHRVF